MKRLFSFFRSTREPQPAIDRYWSKLEHAYGDASDVPKLLEGLAPDSNDPIWLELWSRLCHQGTVYSASFAALPHLAEFAGTLDPAERHPPLWLAAAIASCPSIPDFVPDGGRDSYAEVRDRLKGLASESLSAVPLPEGEFGALLHAVAVFSGDASIGQAILDISSDGEIQAECNECVQYFAFTWHGQALQSPADADSDNELPVVVSVAPVSLTAPSDHQLQAAVRYQRLALDAGHAGLAAAFPSLCGKVICPVCSHEFTLYEAIPPTGSAP
ncbi:MAG: hypothetical protein GY722_21210 [bacterium]|nr:hypothetical protein [bacterium]